jgi:hypothetical protein
MMYGDVLICLLLVTVVATVFGILAVVADYLDHKDFSTKSKED